MPKNVKVFSNRGAFNIPVAEHAWAIILALAKMVGRKIAYKTYLLTYKTLLILGAVELGSELARIGNLAFNPEDICCKSYVRSFFKQFINSFFIYCIPSPKYTFKILNYDLLKLVPKECIIVNIGRGDTIEEEGIYKLLKERPDVRIATDVFWIKS